MSREIHAHALLKLIKIKYTFLFVRDDVKQSSAPDKTVLSPTLIYNENALPAVEAHVVNLLPGGHDICQKLYTTKIWGQKKGFDKSHLWSPVVFFFFILISALANSSFPSLLSLPCSTNFLFLAFSNSWEWKFSTPPQETDPPSFFRVDTFLLCRYPKAWKVLGWGIYLQNSLSWNSVLFFWFDH